MYFPYLRGKQFELIAIRELVEMMSATGKIIPIIEPVKEVASYKKTFEALHQHICVLAKNLDFDGIVYKSTLYPLGTNVLFLMMKSYSFPKIIGAGIFIIKVKNPSGFCWLVK